MTLLGFPDLPKDSELNKLHRNELKDFEVKDETYSLMMIRKNHKVKFQP